MNLFERFFGLQKLITATIVVHGDDDARYSAETAFTEHRPAVPGEEYVRLVLHYYAKTMHTMNRKSAGAQFLIKKMRPATYGPLGRESDIVGHFDLRAIAPPVRQPAWIGKSKHYRTTLSQIASEPDKRYMQNKIAFTGEEAHLVFSVLALLQACLGKLDQTQIGLLTFALNNMQRAYESAAAFDTTQTVYGIPETAFAAALRRRGKKGAAE